MNAKEGQVNDLLEFLDESPSAYHATGALSGRLKVAGFIHLDESAKWHIEDGGSYYIKRNDSSLIAFKAGHGAPWEGGFKIAGAHTDSPALKIKPESVTIERGVVKVSVEVYGGPIISSWLDRELAIAGRVILLQNGGYSSRLVKIDKACALIPNLAIHLNKDVNQGFEYNRQTHLQAILGLTDNPSDSNCDPLRELIAHRLAIAPQDIVEMDLFLYDTQKAALCGINEEFISSSRQDNLAMCHAILKSFLATPASDTTNIAVFYDNEEVGSNTPYGADSSFLRDLLDRIIMVKGGSRDDLYRASAKSFMISADAAHAVHPNFSEKHDPSYAPIMNRGPVIKSSANYRYATTAETSAYFTALCQKAEVPYQRIKSRSDIPSGSTIGPMSSALLGIKTVDVGNSMWGMHSIREVQGTKDHCFMIEVLSKFFSGG